MCCITYLNSKKRDKYLKCKIVLQKTKAEINDYNLYDSFYICLFNPTNPKMKDEIKIDLNGTSGVSKESEECIDFSLQGRTVKHSGYSWEVKNEVEFCNNASDAIVVLIGDSYKQLLKKYRSAFSYALFWDDKISRVSKAVDEWEYEINKIIKVLETNSFVSDIFVVGNVNNCQKAVGFLLSSCKKCNTINHDDLKWTDKESISSPYFLSGEKILVDKTLHIITDDDSKDNNKMVQDKLNDELNGLFISSQTGIICNCIQPYDSMPNIASEKIENYTRIHKILRKDHSINAENLDEAYKMVVTSLLLFGEEQTDSYNKKIRELKGVTISVSDIKNDKYRMSFRRDEIDSYYQSQWISENGEIYKSIHANQNLNVNQFDIIIDGIVNTISKKNGSRKLMFSFYRPTEQIIENFEMPSLLECFIYVRYGDDKVFLDSVFTWRTNECVLGLPMSLESSIRWIDEVVLPRVSSRVDVDVQLGNYQYIGINMHCFDNEITREMVARIVEERKSATRIRTIKHK